MYNQDIKRRFIAECVSDGYKENTEQEFNICEKIEEPLGKDLAEMNYHEAKYLMENIMLPDVSRIESTLSLCRKYVEWCKSETIFNQVGDGFLKLTPREVDLSITISKRYFRDENDLLHALQKVKSIDEGYPDVIAAVFLWLGLDIRDSLKLREQNVDLANRIVADESGEVLVNGFSDVICDLFTQYSKMTTATRWDREVIKDLSYDTFIKRFATRDSVYLGKRMNYNSVRRELAKDNQKYVELGYPPRLTSTNILKSGYLHKLWELEQSGVDLYAKDSKTIVEGVYKKSNYRRIIWQYEYYKKAFNL